MKYRSVYDINIFLISFLLFFTQCLLSSYGTIELAIYLRAPKYRNFNTLLNIVRQQETSQQKKIIRKYVNPKDLHITLTYPLIPLDDEIINLFPHIKHDAKQLSTEQQIQLYHKAIPTLLSKWLTPRLMKTFARSDRWRTPIALPFTQLQKLGVFLTATFSLDTKNRLLRIVNSINSETKKLFSKTSFAYDSIILHLSLGIMNPLFNPGELIQPETAIAPLIINKKLEHSLVVSARMKKE